MKKILITGSGGFVGRNISEYLAGSYTLFTPRSSELDMLDTVQVEKYLSKHSFDCVVHCAADVISRNYKKDVSVMLQNNLRMYFNLERCSEMYGRMIYFGSGAEYDKEHYIPKMPETYFGKHIPRDPYGFSKYIQGKFISANPKIIDLRLFGCYGKYEDWEVRFISNAICRVMYDMDISMHQNVYFDYTYVKDVAKIVSLFINKPRLSHQHYNVCTGTTIDLRSLAEIILKVAGKNKKIVAEKKGRNTEYSGDNARLRKQFPKLTFTSHEDAISELYAWYVSNKKNIKKSLLILNK